MECKNYRATAVADAAPPKKKSAKHVALYYTRRPKRQSANFCVHFQRAWIGAHA